MIKHSKLGSHKIINDDCSKRQGQFNLRPCLVGLLSNVATGLAGPSLARFIAIHYRIGAQSLHIVELPSSVTRERERVSMGSEGRDMGKNEIPSHICLLKAINKYFISRDVHQ
jgi:hypothetical protein